MNWQQGAMQEPRGNCAGADQHASVSRKQSSEDRRTKNEDVGGDTQQLIQCASEDLMRMQFERDQTWNGAGAERAENPGAHRHGGSMFKHAQHVEEEVGAGKIHIVINNGSARDYRGHSGDSTEKKVERNLPRPDRRFDNGLPVVTRFAGNRAPGNIHAFVRNDALFPRLLAQFFESLFGWRSGCHEKNAKANSVAMMDAIAVAKAEVHADFR